MPLLTGIVRVEDSNGERIDVPNADGTHAPIVLKFDSTLRGTPTLDGSLVKITLSAPGAGGGGVVSFSNHAAFRSTASANLSDGQVVHFQSPLGDWVYFTGTGAGEADDDRTILKPTDISLGSNGRLYSLDSPTLPNITALRLAVSGKQSTIHVQGYATVGDGGGGIFDYDSSDTTSADNGGTIIVAGTRRYKRRAQKGLYDFCWFGASPSASMATNTAAILAAATAANAAGGGTVWVPDGDYNVIVPSGHGSSAFHVTGFSNVTIQGSGRYKARLVDGGSQASAGELYPTEQGDPGGTAAFLTFQDCTGIHIRDLGFVGKGVFDQASAGQTAVNKKAIYFKWTIAGGTTDCSVEDCYFTLIEGETVFGDGWPTRLLVNRNHFVRCLSNQINYGSSTQAVNKSIDCSADDNVIESPGASAFQGGGTNYSFCRNKISMLPADAAITTSTAILVVNSTNFLHEGNIFDGLIYAGGSPIVRFGYQGDTDGNVGARIRNNTFSNCAILGKSVDPSAAIISIDASYGDQIGYDISDNKFLNCRAQNHASYPNVIAVRVWGAFDHLGKIGPNKIDSPSVANGVQTAVCINSTVLTSNKIIVGEHQCDSQVTTPYDFSVEPFAKGITFGQPDVKLTFWAGTPEGNVVAGKGSMCGDITNGTLYVKNTGTGNTGWSLLASASGFVPNSRALTGSGAIKIAGDNNPHDLSADRTISVADAASGTKGVIELDTDLGGTAAAPTVVQLTGSGGLVSWLATLSTPNGFTAGETSSTLFQILGLGGSQTCQLNFGSIIQFVASGTGLVYDADLHQFRSKTGGATFATVDSGGVHIGSSGTGILKHLSASQAPTFGTVNANTANENEFSFSGASVGDAVYVAPDADPGAGLVWCAYVKTINTVTIRLANVTTGNVTSNNVNWRIDVWKH